jgi:hypothetical protein
MGGQDPAPTIFGDANAYGLSPAMLAASRFWPFGLDSGASSAEGDGSMSDKSKTVSVEFGELRDAYQFASFAGTEYAAYVSLETGKVYFVTGQEDLDAEVPDDIGVSDDYLALPDKRSLELGTRLVFAFALQVIPDEYDAIRDIFRRKGAYRRFKDFLNSNGWLEQWHEFEAKATDEALCAWCRDNGIELKER